jgi:CxxC motif-containing protein
MGCELTVTVEDGAVTNVTGNTCPRGAKYAKDEVTAPKRMLTSTVAIEGGVLPLLPVVSADVLPKERVLDCAAYLRGVKAQAPVKAGDVIVADILGLGVNIIASRDMDLHQQ